MDRAIEADSPGSGPGEEMDARWRIELFGGLRVRQGDQVITHFATRKTAALLACLAFYQSRAHSRDWLAEQLWPAEDPRATRTRLRQALSALRRVLEPAGIPPGSVVVADHTDVRLNPRAISTDVAEFHEALQLAAQAPTLDERVERLSHAAHLYGGELLPGSCEAWIHPEREALASAYLGALHQLIESLERAGDRPRALDYARRAVSADPLCEEAARDLMRLYWEAGRTPDALRLYRDLERRLRDDLGALPSAPTRDLAAQIAAGSAQHPAEEPTTRAPQAPAPVPAPLAIRSAGKRSPATILLLCLTVLAVMLAGLSLSRQAAAPPPKSPSIAVLPFAYRSTDPRYRYLADAMADEIRSRLKRIERLVVKRAPPGIDRASIDEELAVETLLEGSVRKEGDTLRITVRLVDAESLEDLWAAQPFDRVLRPENVLALQKEIADRIATELEGKLGAGDRRAIARNPTANSQAYNSYLLGLYFWNRRTEEDLWKAIRHFEAASRQDPGYALAYGGIADCYNLLGYYGYLPSNRAYPPAKEAGLKALKNASGDKETLARAHTALAWAEMVYNHDWQGARAHFQKAIAAHPRYATAHQWYSLYLMVTGRVEESFREIRRAQNLDPVSLVINTSVGGRYYTVRRLGDAIREYQRVLAMDPSYSVTRFWLGLAYQRAGRYREAVEEFRAAERLSGPRAQLTGALGLTYATWGKRDEAGACLHRLRQRQSQGSYVTPIAMALLHMGLGERDQAFAWLDRAYLEKAMDLILVKEAAPTFDPLRGDSRFPELLRKMGLTE
jgi:DNA-binding SARP family transcriptional activator/TolB-like protein/Tfp pilus assembly protein PilF